jgi:phytoene dehydrogenase-like protein
MRKHYEHYVTNLDERNVVAWSFHTPLEMVEDSPTFQRGDVGGVGKFFFQIGGHRPTPELSQYAVPGVKGLYLAGTFMHPPGGITGGGRATAVKMCGDLGIKFDKLVGK